MGGGQKRRDLPSKRDLPPIVLQVLGVLLLVAFAALYYLTGRESSLLIAAALSLAFSGQLFRISIGQENREKEALREALETYEQAKRKASETGRGDSPGT